MKLMRIRAVSRKEFIHILRDPRSLGMAVAIPMLLLLLFGYALTLDVDNVPLVVWAQEDSPIVQDLVRRFSASPYFSLQGEVGSYEELEYAIDSRTALIALVIPAGFSGRIESGRTAPVQGIVDGSDSNTASIAISYAQAVTAAYSQDIALRTFQRLGEKTADLPVQVEARVWFNDDRESKNYIIPGLIAVIMMVIAALLTSLTIAREWEQGTMEQLISTPVKAPELVIGKLFPYFVIGMVDVLLSVLMGEYLFHVPLHGSIPLLFAMAAVFLMGALSLGILISIVTKSQLVASQLAMVLTFLPAFLLSGFMYAISNMPRAVQMLTYLIPARYFVALLKGIYLKGTGFAVLYQEIILLSVFGLLMFLLAIAKFKKKLV